MESRHMTKQCSEVGRRASAMVPGAKTPVRLLDPGTQGSPEAEARVLHPNSFVAPVHLSQAYLRPPEEAPERAVRYGLWLDKASPSAGPGQLLFYYICSTLAGLSNSSCSRLAGRELDGCLSACPLGACTYLRSGLERPALHFTHTGNGRSDLLIAGAKSGPKRSPPNATASRVACFLFPSRNAIAHHGANRGRYHQISLLALCLLNVMAGV